MFSLSLAPPTLRRVIACAAAALSVSAGATSAPGLAESFPGGVSSREAIRPPTPSLQSPEDALRRDLELVAEIKGWSVEEAVVRHRAADAVGALAVELASAWPDVFVGSVLNESPLGPPAVYIKGEVPQAIEALVARAGTQIAIVDGQPFSAVELEERSRVVHEHLVTAGFEEVSTGYRIEDRGEIRAAVRQAGGRTVDDGDVLAALPTDLRGSVRLEAADSPTVVDEHAYGGM